MSPSTLRAWERRYGVVEPVRTEGGYRVYDDDSLKRLTRMSSLIASGWPPRHAAAYVMNEDGDGVLPLGVVDEEPRDPVPPTMKEEREQIEVLLQAAEHLDARRLSDELDFAFSIHSFDDLVGRWLGPVLKATSEAHASGRLSDAGEHFLTSGIERRLAACYEAAGQHGHGSGPRVVTGVPQREGARPIGSLAFATSLRRHGCSVVYLGARATPEEWVEAVRTHDADCIGISVPHPEDSAGAAALVTALTAMRPQLTVYYGGRGSDRVRLKDATLLTGTVGGCAERIVSEHQRALARAS